MKLFLKYYGCCICTCILVCLSAIKLNAQQKADTYTLRLQLLESSKDDYDILKEKFIQFKKELEHANKINDSVYARVLDRIAFYDYIKTQSPTERSLAYTQKAIGINLSKNGSRRYLVIEYLNLGNYYYMLNQYHQALNMIDSSIFYAYNYYDNLRMRALITKGQILEDLGEFDAGIDVYNIGLNIARQVKDTAFIQYYFKRLSNVYYLFKRIDKAFACVDSCFYYLKLNNDVSMQLDALKVKALCYKSVGSYQLAKKSFSELLQLQKNYDDSTNKAIYLIEAGEFYELISDYNKAFNLFKQAAVYSKPSKINSQFVRSYLDICELHAIKNDYEKAKPYYNSIIQWLVPDYKGGFLNNPAAAEFNLFSEKDVIQTYLINKTELLLLLYKQNNNASYLNAAIETCKTADSVITQIRFEQSEETSKLYWRDTTRKQYNLAMEACYLAGNTSLAYYFLEKSRSVLLNDNLNEIAAELVLPANEILKQNNYKVKVKQDYSRLSSINEHTAEYIKARDNLQSDKEEQRNYIQFLEKKYPAYYQDKYNNNTASLKDLQHFLKKKNSGFISYFTGDTAMYIISVSSKNIHLTKLGKNIFCKDSITAFYSLCTNMQKLMNNYGSFSSLSNYLYRLLFVPAGLVTKNIIVCPDAFLIPFEALCSDANGRDFLVKKYAFSYVYSSTFLLHKFDNKKAQGNFLGVAPVSFSAKLGLYSLNQSADVLRTTASYYNGSVLLTNTTATRKNFLAYAGNYSIINILSHAKANGQDEPVLYMCDSAIRLSELQNMPRQAARLIVLSACETNTGKLATGEGIYSLARGFAAAGVPSVAATLWKADELAIYSITARFNQYLAEGMTKDNALQKSKTDFLNNNPGSNSLPYYWANMILMGNTDEIHLIHSSDSNLWIVIAATLAISAFIVWLMIWKRKARRFH